MYSVREKSGKATYKRVDCGWTVILDHDDDRFPPCGNCSKGHNTKYARVG